MSCDLFITKDELTTLIRQEAQKISFGNGFYNWSLVTPEIKATQLQYCLSAETFLQGKLTRNQFLASLHLYFDAVYKATLEDFVRRCESSRKPDAGAALPIDTVKLTRKDLEYLNYQYIKWFGADDWFVWEGFDNDIGEQDYSHIVLFEVGKFYEFQFGKHRDKTLEFVMQRDPSYLIWLKTNTSKLDTVKPELWQEILACHSRQQRERYNEESN